METGSELEVLKAEEKQAWNEFTQAVQAVLHQAQNLKELANRIYKAGGTPEERTHFMDVISACQNYLVRQNHQEGIQAHVEQKRVRNAELISRSGRTYTLKGR